MVGMEKISIFLDGTPDSEGFVHQHPRLKKVGFAAGKFNLLYINWQSLKRERERESIALKDKKCRSNYSEAGWIKICFWDRCRSTDCSSKSHISCIIHPHIQPTTSNHLLCRIKLKIGRISYFGWHSNCWKTSWASRKHLLKSKQLRMSNDKVLIK